MINTLTYAIHIKTTPEQSKTLTDTCSAYLSCCNTVSKVAWEHRTLSQKQLHQLVYRRLRDEYHVGAQMACSSINRVIGNYRTIKEMHRSPWATSNPAPRGLQPSPQRDEAGSAGQLAVPRNKAPHPRSTRCAHPRAHRLPEEGSRVRCRVRLCATEHELYGVQALDGAPEPRRTHPS